MPALYGGTVEGDVNEARFAYSGKVSALGKRQGDTVKQWEWIASLDKKVLQSELDLELADYEKARAEFEIFNLKNGQASDDITKFLRSEKQAALNASVKRVELAKYKMDQADLVSPATGILIDMGGLVPGINITPASASVKILVTSPLYFHFEVPQKDLVIIAKSRTMRLTVTGLDKKYTLNPTLPAYGKQGVFACRTVITDPTDLKPGMTGKASVHL